jgi:serine/threonine protein kinase
MVGTYRVVHKLGEGGMGTVYLGEHTLLGRPAAIKVLQPSLSTSEEVVARFFNEARAVIAKLAGDEPGVIKTRTGVLMGTPMYMSPEQCSGSSVVDHRSDIYSLGCVMFAMVTKLPDAGVRPVRKQGDLAGSAGSAERPPIDHED